MAPRVVPVASLIWPPSSGGAPLETATVHRVGRPYLDRIARSLGIVPFDRFSKYKDGDGTSSAVGGPSGGAASSEKKAAERDLFALSSDDLSDLSHYEILGDIPMHSSSERVKRAYRRACLKYHPDKTGRGEEDEVFLAVKASFDTLSDPNKRKSYDSTVDFDDSIPKGGEGEEEFYSAYGPVFERNLRFASFNDPTRNVEDTPKPKGKKKGKKGGRKASSEGAEEFVPPELGDDETDMGDVHKFYDFWTHFESWRDFTLKATELTEHDVDMADSRDEKRWMAKEIDRKARAMKKEEVARIALLVERAMAADPRLRREREQEREEKRKAAEDKKKRKAEEERKKREKREREEKERAEKEQREREEKAKAKAAKEQEKKQMRKARQLLRKLVVSGYQNAPAGKKVWDDMESMNDDVELLCDALEMTHLTELTDALGGSDAEESGRTDFSALPAVQECADKARQLKGEKTREAKRERDKGRAAAEKKAAAARAARATRSWTKEELSALAKGVKKYPPGGANRWDAIAQFVNNLCKPDEPRTKEECIEKYNQLAQQKKGGGKGSGGSGGGTAASAAMTVASTGAGAGKSATKSAGGGGGTDDWTEEQDKALQEGLAKFPASMDKNERWSNIAKGVGGKSKKECVQRFKAIREALKQKK